MRSSCVTCRARACTFHWPQQRTAEMLLHRATAASLDRTQSNPHGPSRTASPTPAFGHLQQTNPLLGRSGHRLQSCRECTHTLCLKWNRLALLLGLRLLHTASPTTCCALRTLSTFI